MVAPCGVARRRRGARRPAQRVHAVEHVEAAAMRRDRDVVRHHDEIRHRDHRQVQRQRLPGIAVVVRDVHALLRAGVEHALLVRILAHRVHVVILTDAVRDLRPRRAVVACAEDVWVAIVEQGTLHRRESGAGVERRGVDDADAAKVRHVLRRDVRPRRAAVAGDVNQSVVRARPDRLPIHLARRNREDHAIDLGAVHVTRDRAAGRSHRLRIVTRQVTRQRRPVLAAVACDPQTLGADVQRLGIELRIHDRVGPLPALLHHR
jgi:hypothetical protein